MGFIGAYLGLALRRVLAASPQTKLAGVAGAIALVAAGVAGFGSTHDQTAIRADTPTIVLPAATKPSLGNSSAPALPARHAAASSAGTLAPPAHL